MAKRRSNEVPAEPVAVTGVASGGLGTAANLEDTQLWDLEELRAGEQKDVFEPANVFEPVELSEPVPMPTTPATPEPAPATPRVAPVRAEAQPVRAEAQPVRAAALPAPRGQRRTGLMAAAAVGIVALAALLALRDGLPGGAARGSGDAAGAFPSLPAVASPAPQPTAAPNDGGSGGGGKGHGNGKGNGKGNGH